jgi:O-antigen biosynthesis protein
MFVNPFPSPFPTAFPGIQFASAPKPAGKIAKDPNQPHRYVNFMADRGGCGMWRIGWPEYMINMTGKGDSLSTTKMILDKEWYRDVTAIKLQRQASGPQKDFIKFLKSIQPELGFKLIYEVDDVVFREDIPDYNNNKKAFDNDEIRQNCIDMINMVDEVTVTCDFMKTLYQERTGKKEITVIPNFAPYWWIGHQYDYKKIINTFEKNKKKPRIVYAGSAAHFDIGNNTNQQDDFTHVIKFIIDNIDKYQFIFMGAVPPPLVQYAFSKKIEVYPWKNLLEYPNFLNSLDAQLFLAPLQDNNFNRSKSDIKYIEAASLGIPCLCQDMVTYENALPNLKFTDGDDLANKVDELLNWKNRSKYFQLVPQLREIASHRFLELDQNIGCHIEALNTPYGDASRQFLKKWN